MATGSGCPGEPPLPPGTDPERLGQLGFDPGLVVDLDLDPFDPGVGRPGDAGDDLLPRCEAVSCPRRGDAGLCLDRALLTPSPRDPVGFQGMPNGQVDLSEP